VAWRECEIAYKRLSKNRQVNISKAYFNIWHTGRKNGRYYSRKKSCCLCNALEEDWIHILTCPSIDACMSREELWAKVRKVMTHWKLPNEFWAAMKKGRTDTHRPQVEALSQHLSRQYTTTEGITSSWNSKNRMG
jgi:hypothetical protein